MFVCIMYVCEYGNVCGGQSTTSKTWFSPSIVVLRTTLKSFAQ